MVVLVASRPIEPTTKSSTPPPEMVEPQQLLMADSQ